MSAGEIRECADALREIEELALVINELEGDERKARLYDLLRQVDYVRVHLKEATVTQ